MTTKCSANDMDWPPEDPAFTEAQLSYFLYKDNPLQCSVIVADVRIPPTHGVHFDISNLRSQLTRNSPLKLNEPVTRPSDAHWRQWFGQVCFQIETSIT